MTVRMVMKEKKVETEYERVVSYYCDICGQETDVGKVVYYETLDVEASHTGNLEMCQPCSKAFEEEEQKLIDRLRKDRGWVEPPMDRVERIP